MELKIEDLLREIAELRKEIEKLKLENEQLRKENAELKARLGMNSSNSSLPPSSDKFVKKKKEIGLYGRKAAKHQADKLDIKVLLLRKLVILISL